MLAFEKRRRQGRVREKAAQIDAVEGWNHRTSIIGAGFCRSRAGREPMWRDSPFDYAVDSAVFWVEAVWTPEERDL